MLLVLVLGIACTPPRKKVAPDLVRRIKFEGNGGLFSGHTDLALRGAMEQKQSPALTLTFPFMYFTTPVAYQRRTLQADARRLEIWYAHHGRFDARFLGWEVRRVRARHEGRAGVVDLIGHVEPGPMSTIHRVTVDGDLGVATRTIVSGAMSAQPTVEGDDFSLEDVEATAERIADELRDNGYAYATVVHQVDAYPDAKQVDVAFDVQPGIRTRFGTVTIEGLERVDEELVRGVLRTERGEPYRASTLRHDQAELFRTQLFGLVDVKPDLSDPTAELVPIVVTLTEARLRRLRFGVGLRYDYFTLSPEALLGYRDNHLFGSGFRLDLNGAVGAYIGVVRDDEGEADVLLTGLAKGRLSYPWLMKGRLGFAVGLSFEQDAQFGDLPFWKVSSDIGVSYKIDPFITLTAGPTFEYFRYLEPNASTLEAARLQFGGEFTGAEFRLLSADLGLRIDYRDDPLRTRRGTYWAADVRQSIPIPSFTGNGGVETGFLYTKLKGEVRGWIPVRVSRKQVQKRLVLGGRLAATGLVPWDLDNGALPYPDLAFLGGPNSLRGFRQNQVGPYDALCSYRGGRPDPQHNNGLPYDLTRTYLPRGGTFAAEVMAEARYDLDFGVSVAVFGDAGILSRQWDELSADQFRGGGGIGLRYDSPVGPIRLDLGLRPTFPEDFGPRRYIGCNQIDRLPAGYDLLTSGIDARSVLDQRTFPLAINLFLAIGEAF